MPQGLKNVQLLNLIIMKKLCDLLKYSHYVFILLWLSYVIGMAYYLSQF